MNNNPMGQNFQNNNLQGQNTPMPYNSPNKMPTQPHGPGMNKSNFNSEGNELDI